MKPLAAMPAEFLKQIQEQAEREYPSECCGMIFGPRTKPGTFSRIRPCRNVQDEYHKKDPGNFPRPSKTAYFIEPKELLAIQKELRQQGEEIRIIYHSHIDMGAYFSDEDTRIAAPDGEPSYPGTEYLVLSVIKGKVKDVKLYHWDPVKKFVPS